MSFKSKLSKLIAHISPALFFRIAYFHNRGRWLNLKNPQDLSEIWIKHLLAGKVNDIAYLADKYAVREYVKQKGLEDILVPLLAVWETGSAIEFTHLPQRFAIKANWGAGKNIICTDKSSFNADECRARCTKWLSEPAQYSYSEYHYNLIPHKIICEAFIEDSKGLFPLDYKFICINGEPCCVLACFGRETGHASYMPYSLDWKPLPEYNKHIENYVVEKPKNLDTMIQIAKTLAEGLELVRVDLYDTGERIFFGEMTLTPAGCIFHRWSQKALDDMGAIYREAKIK